MAKRKAKSRDGHNAEAMRNFRFTPAELAKARKVFEDSRRILKKEEDW